MSIGVELILTTLATTPPACDWSNPGADPYRGDPVAAVVDFGLPLATSDALRHQLRAHAPTDTVTITRDDIVGYSGAYSELREMHSGHGRICHGAVDRSAWRATRREKALVYCADDACIIVPSICHNVSLVSRKPEHAANAEGPIDIEPAAGPQPSPLPSASPSSTSSPEDGPLAFMPTPEGGEQRGAPGGGGSVGDTPPGSPVDGLPPIAAGGGDGGSTGDFPPSLPPPDGGLPGRGVGAPPVAMVPEVSAWLLLLMGLVALWPCGRRPSRSAGRPRA